MFKTFLVGIFLGICTAAACLHSIPLVDQVREQSFVVVHPNHGNTETFHVNIPTDQILAGPHSPQAPLPAELQWPQDELFAGVQTEMFKLRNINERVVGVASRISVGDERHGESVEWVLHLPARGSIYASLGPAVRDGGYRVGPVRAGTREFGKIEGQVTERWVADTTGIEYAPDGRIEIITAFVAREEAR
jgi:hypothetical protein